MIEHFMNGMSHVINIFCDTSGCSQQDSVFCDTRQMCVSVLSERGWRFNNEWQHVCPHCAAQQMRAPDALRCTSDNGEHYYLTYEKCVFCKHERG